jgi:magnesium chelatase family protein
MTQAVSTTTSTARVWSTTLIGFAAERIRIDVRVVPGAASFNLNGPLSETSQREIGVRVLSALNTIGADVLPRHDRRGVEVSLTSASGVIAPATADLPIAVAVLAALGKVPASALDDVTIVGELSLNGAIRPIRGALAHVLGAKELGFQSVILPESNGMEAGAASGISVHVAASLRDIIAHLRGEATLTKANSNPPPAHNPGADTRFDFSDVIGLHGAKRVLEIAAAGAHNTVILGPPSSGKTMLARRAATILPPLTDEEAVAVTMIHSIAGLLPENAPIRYTRPFRAPHHTVSDQGLTGAASTSGFRPGELSLAHFGVLFLDDLLEFRRSALDTLPTILERGDVTMYANRGIARGSFPAAPLVIAAASECPRSCTADCKCEPVRVDAYRIRFVQATSRTFDLRIRLSPAHSIPQDSDDKPESSATIRERVIGARMVRAGRPNGCFNSIAASLDTESAKLLSEATARLKLTGADYSKMVRVARTIADLDGSTMIRSRHAAEAASVTNVSSLVCPT